MNPPIPSTWDPITPPAAPSTPIPTPAAPAPVISPAQTPVAPVIPSTPVLSSAPTQDFSSHEARIRFFQSEADKAKAEADRLAREAETAKRELETLRITSSTVLEGTRQVAEDALRKVEELSRAREQDRAQALKANMLLEEGYRPLVPYAGFIQPTNDETQLRAQLNALKAAREADLAAHQPTQTPAAPLPPTPPAFSTPSVQPVPGVQPVRPQPTAVPGSSGNVADQIKLIMQSAHDKLMRNQSTIVEYEQEMQKARDLATAEAHRQAGRVMP